MGHQGTPWDLDKPQSGRYAEIILLIFRGHTTPDNENPLNCKTTQPINILYPQ